MSSFGLNASEILDYQANRNPYLMFDKVLEVVPGESCVGVKNLSQNEWYFPVHFPNDPCMPGFLQAEAMTQVCALTILTLDGNKGKVVLLLSCENLRLFKKVRPGDVMIIKTKLLSYRHGIAKGCGRCYVEDKLVSEATISFTLSESEERQQLIPKMRNI